jgi:hypothetical protein
VQLSSGFHVDVSLYQYIRVSVLSMGETLMHTARMVPGGGKVGSVAEGLLIALAILAALRTLLYHPFINIYVICHQDICSRAKCRLTDVCSADTWSPQYRRQRVSPHSSQLLGHPDSVNTSYRITLRSAYMSSNAVIVRSQLLRNHLELFPSN